MEREVNEEKRNKFIEYAGKRVNNVLHDIQILEPMARSNNYDFTRQDVSAMFNAMQDALNEAQEEFNRKFDEKAKAEKKMFSFAAAPVQVSEANTVSAQPIVSNTQEQANTVAEKVQAAISEEVVEEIPNDDVLAEVISDEIEATNL